MLIVYNPLIANDNRKPLRHRRFQVYRNQELPVSLLIYYLRLSLGRWTPIHLSKVVSR